MAKPTNKQGVPMRTVCAWVNQDDYNQLAARAIRLGKRTTGKSGISRLLGDLAMEAAASERRFQKQQVIVQEAGVRG